MSHPSETSSSWTAFWLGCRDSVFLEKAQCTPSENVPHSRTAATEKNEVLVSSMRAKQDVLEERLCTVGDPSCKSLVKTRNRRSVVEVCTWECHLDFWKVTGKCRYCRGECWVLTSHHTPVSWYLGNESRPRTKQDQLRWYQR